ncbi:MAG: hypothetical protein GYA21_13285 [Myxococcales bacterium]|nr:hypothetical protein [Myxococcales bacterium]
MNKATALLLAFALAAPAWGQPQSEGQEGGGIASEFERAAALPDAEKIERSAQYLAEMKQILGTVLKLLKEARDEKDVIKVNCVNEKLTSIKGLMRISEQADMALQEAVAKGESDTSAHEFHKLVISHQKIKILKTEAEQCVGELAFAVGKTNVEIEVDRDVVPQEDPTMIPLPDTPVVRPPAASPYQ